MNDEWKKVPIMFYVVVGFILATIIGYFIWMVIK